MKNQKRLTLFLGLMLFFGAVGMSFTLKAEPRGKWDVEIGTTSEGNPAIRLHCRYSLFIKECSTTEPDIIIFE